MYKGIFKGVVIHEILESVTRNIEGHFEGVYRKFLGYLKEV